MAIGDAVRIRILGTDLPGSRWGDHAHVHVGVQRGRAVVDMVPGGAARAVFELDARLVSTEDGPDLRGPYVHGRRGERFLYLSWGDLPPGGEFAMFRRAKLHLSVLPAEQLHAAARGGVLEGELRLTDGCGGPLCASIRPPAIGWQVR